MDKTKNKTILKNNLYILKIFANISFKYMIVTFFIKLISIYDTIISIYLIRYLINVAINKNVSIKKVFIELGIICVSYILIRTIESTYNNKFLPVQQIEFRKKFCTEMFKKTVGLDYSIYENPEYFNQYSYVLEEAENRFFSVFDCVSDFIVDIIQICFVVSSVVFVFKEWIIVLFPIIIIVANTFLFTKVSRYIFDRNQENILYNRKINYVKRVFYLRDYAKELRITNISSTLYDIFEKASNDSSKVYVRYSKKIVIVNFLLSFLYQVFSRFGLLLYLFIKVYLDIISVADFSGLYSAANSLLVSFQSLSDVVKRFYDNDLYIRKFREFDSLSIKRKEEGIKIDLMKLPWNEIIINNIHFSYDGVNDILKGISFKIKRGEKIAIVGDNGAGKTTLIDILLGLYSPQKGNIMIDDIPITDVDTQTYFGNFGVVPQFFNLYATTLANNILMDSYKIEDEKKIIDALKCSELDQKIMSWQEGIHSQITREFNEEGIYLSGGEMQKVAIARVFVNKRPIILLDEPSSAIDPISEYNIFRTIFSVFKDETIIFISHRLYVTTLSDRILVMENGKIIEEGNHDMLLSQRGRYSELYKATTENYRINESDKC